MVLYDVMCSQNISATHEPGPARLCRIAPIGVDTTDTSRIGQPLAAPEERVGVPHISARILARTTPLCQESSRQTHGTAVLRSRARLRKTAPHRGHQNRALDGSTPDAKGPLPGTEPRLSVSACRVRKRMPSLVCGSGTARAHGQRMDRGIEATDAMRDEGSIAHRARAGLSRRGRTHRHRVDRVRIDLWGAHLTDTSARG